MKRIFYSAILLLLLLSACATSRQTAQSSPDFVHDPTAIGAIDEGVREGTAAGEDVEPAARRAGRAAGILAAVLGGPDSESVDDVIDRYRAARDATHTAIVAATATKAAIEGAQFGYDFDVQFAELLQIEGLDVTRPYVDEIVIRFQRAPEQATLEAIAKVLVGRQERAVTIQGGDECATSIYTGLAGLGVSYAKLDRDVTEPSTTIVYVRMRG